MRIHSNPGVYKITIPNSGKYYIGKSKNCSKRVKEHIKDLNANKHCNIAMQLDYNNSNKDEIIKEVLEYCTINELHDREVFYITKYDAINSGYNIEMPKANKHNCKISYNGRIYIYDLHTLTYLAVANGVDETSTLLKVPSDMICRCLAPSTNNIFKGVLRDYILLEEGRSINDFKDDYDIMMKNKLERQVRLTKDAFNEQQRIKSLSAAIKNRKRVGRFDLYGNLIDEYSCAGEVENCNNNIKAKYIRKAISGEQKTYKGYIWKYI